MPKTRKQRESNAETFASGALLIAIVCGLFAWHKTGDMRVGIGTLLGAMACVLAFVWLQRSARLRKRSRLTLEEIDAGTWEEFESYLLALFHVQGYKAELTPNGADFGADLILERGGKRTVVQAKHWHTRQVGVKAVQEISAAKAHYKATKAMVIITGEFTAQAIQLAHSNDVELWDREKLAKVIDGLGAKEPAFRAGPDASADTAPSEAPHATPVAPQAAPVPAASLTAPACPLCASPMMRRSSRYGQFWGCSQYPDCQGKSS